VLESESGCKRTEILRLLRFRDAVWDTAVGDEGNLSRSVWDDSLIIVSTTLSLYFCMPCRDNLACLIFVEINFLLLKDLDYTSNRHWRSSEVFSYAGFPTFVLASIDIHWHE